MSSTKVLQPHYHKVIQITKVDKIDTNSNDVGVGRPSMASIVDSDEAKPVLDSKDDNILITGVENTYCTYTSPLSSKDGIDHLAGATKYTDNNNWLSDLETTSRDNIDRLNKAIGLSSPFSAAGATFTETST